MKLNRVKSVAMVLGLCLLGLAAGALAADEAGKRPVQSVDSSAGEVTLDCKDGNVLVNGSVNTITLHGVCHDLTINASNNTIVVDSVEIITFNGSENKVTWKKPAGDKPPLVNDLGSGNSAEQASP